MGYYLDCIQIRRCNKSALKSISALSSRMYSKQPLTREIEQPLFWPELSSKDLFLLNL